MQKPGYIVIEGPIGVGKTSLARKLAKSFNGECLQEVAEENPFLERFYENPREAAFPTQLYFLFQRARQIERLCQDDLFRTTQVADYMLEKDRLFARLTLDSDELRLYEQVYGTLSMQCRQPDLVVYLQAPVSVLMKRVAKRGRAVEKSISVDYLERISESYANFFHRYNQTPLLIVNATEINPVENEADYQSLLKQVRSVRSGRHYFNPLPMEWE